MDRMTGIEVFIKVVDAGGFSAAGRRLGMSVTMVSNHVKMLEQRLGARLLNRTTRKVSLTESGKEYYQRTVRICSDLEEAEISVGDGQITPRGTLKIYAASAMTTFLSPIVAEYLEVYAQAEVEITIGERWVDLVEEGYDLAVRVLPAPNSSMIVKTITPWRHQLCASPIYLERHREPKEPADLTAHNCLRYKYYPFGDEWRFLDKNGKFVDVKISGRVNTNNAEILRQLSLRGIGLFLAPSFVVASDILSGRLVKIMPAYTAVERTIDVLYPHRSHLPAKARVFIDLLAKRLPASDVWMATK